jgi:hypothetical protein
VFARREPDRWPRYNPSELKNAPLSTRARRERRRRRIRATFWVTTFLAALAAASWLLSMTRG